MIRKSKTYYVSSIRGNDKNDGLTQETPFRTLQQLTGRELGPGDRVLLERGSVFEDQYLHIRGKGEKENLIEMQPTGKALCHISVQTEPVSGIRIMVSGWIHRHMYTGEMFLLQSFSMMRNISGSMIWRLQTKMILTDSLSQEKLPVKQDLRWQRDTLHLTKWTEQAWL